MEQIKTLFLPAETKKQLLVFIKASSEVLFDYYVKDGWLVLTDKEVKNDSFLVENFKNGKEFGKMFARTIEMKLEDWIKEKEKENDFGNKGSFKGVKFNEETNKDTG